MSDPDDRGFTLFDVLLFLALLLGIVLHKRARAKEDEDF